METAMDEISHKIMKLCFKRDRDEDEEETVVKRHQPSSELLETKVNVIALVAENQRLRAEMDKRDRVILYGSGEIRRLNADMFTIKQQMMIMSDYVANMEGRAVDLQILAN